MNPAAWALLGAAGGAAVVDWWSVTVGRRAVEYAAKPAALALLIAAAVALHPAHADARAWFVGALVLSLAGDVFLMSAERLFLAGVGSFLLAHVAYIVGLNLHSAGEPAPVVTSVVVVAAAACFAAYVFRAAPRGTVRSLGVPVGVYVAVITAMGASALAAGSAAAAVGALLFMVSDGLIATTRFVRPMRFGRPAIMVTYHVGQALLALSLVA